eukprot:169973-Pleurochrysis_carterae.AAC.1
MPRECDYLSRARQGACSRTASPRRLAAHNTLGLTAAPGSGLLLDIWPALNLENTSGSMQ